MNTPLSVIDRSRRQKITKNGNDLNNTIIQPDVADIYRILHPITEGILLKLMWNSQKRDHVLDHSALLNKS